MGAVSVRVGVALTNPVGDRLGVGVIVGGLVLVGVAEMVGVVVSTVGVIVAVSLGVAVGIVGVIVALMVAVGVGERGAWTSKAPMSHTASLSPLPSSGRGSPR